MSEVFNEFYDLIINTITGIGIWGPLLSCLFIILESIMPPLPLFVFITIEFIAFGKIGGFFISWICTIIGCMVSYLFVKRILGERVRKNIKNEGLLNKCLNYFEHLSVTQITVILSIPFTPAFMMNIAAGLSNMDTKKYFISLLISKIFLVYFWGVVGTGLVESFKNPKSIVTVIIMLLIAYLVSMIIKKVFKLED